QQLPAFTGADPSQDHTEVSLDRLPIDRDLPCRRLPDGDGYRLRADAVEKPTARARCPAILYQSIGQDLFLDCDLADQWVSQSKRRMALRQCDESARLERQRTCLSADGASVQSVGRDHRHRLCEPSVPGPAAVCDLGKA